MSVQRLHNGLHVELTTDLHLSFASTRVTLNEAG